MADKITDALGITPTTPATATADGTEGEENPLEKMDKISKQKEKTDKSSKVLDDAVITNMIKTGENTDGIFTPKEEENHEEEDDKAKIKVGKKVTPVGKYEKQFKNDLLKHPDEYKVMTPRGEMTVTEAIRAGYNPITKRFDKEHGQEKLKEKHLSQLNETDREAVSKLTDPSIAQVAPADAEKYGLPSDSPMVRAQEAPNPIPGMNPAMGQPSPSVPIGGAMPGSEESVAPGAMDLSALLGGGK